jgi:hypothetical protein
MKASVCMGGTVGASSGVLKSSRAGPGFTSVTVSSLCTCCALVPPSLPLSGSSSSLLTAQPANAHCVSWPPCALGTVQLALPTVACHTCTTVPRRLVGRDWPMATQ